MEFGGSVHQIRHIHAAELKRERRTNNVHFSKDYRLLVFRITVISHSIKTKGARDGHEPTPCHAQGDSRHCAR
jgi:hypothetical protein